MSTIVGLDLSLTRAGVAVLHDGRLSFVRSVGHGGKDSASYADRSRRVVSQCRAILDLVDQGVRATGELARLAVIEGPSYGSKFGDPFDRAGLWHGVYAALASRKIPVAVIPPPTLKVWTTGQGNADQGVRGKPMMMAAVKGWFPLAPILNDDHADAVACATVGAFHLGDPVPFKVKDRHAATLEKVDMPTMGASA